MAGATVPSTYSFQKLDLGENASLRIVGPVVVTLATGVTLRSEVGSADHPEWLTLRVASGGVALGEKTTVHGAIIAPNGTVTLGENSVITSYPFAAKNADFIRYVEWDIRETETATNASTSSERQILLALFTRELERSSSLE